MKKLLVALSLVLFVSSLSFAQINKNWDGTKPEVYQGSKCFVFMYAPFVSGALGSAPAGYGISVADTTNITTAPVYGIGFQYFVSSNISLGGGVTFSSNSQEYQKTGRAPTFNWQTLKMSQSTIGVDINANYHFRPLYSVSPYFGLNVNFAMQSATNDGTVIDETGNPIAYKQEYSGNVFGAGLNFGFDWYFTPGLSLGGKYTLGFGTSGGSDVKITQGALTVENKGPKGSTFSTGSASILLNVHF